MSKPLGFYDNADDALRALDNAGPGKAMAVRIGITLNAMEETADIHLDGIPINGIPELLRHLGTDAAIEDLRQRMQAMVDEVDDDD